VKRSAGDPAIQLDMTRRVTRLFRIERNGRLARRPAATARYLIERRGAVIDALIAAAARQRGSAAAGSPELDQALHELASEVGRCRPSAELRRQELAAELRLRRGDAPLSGVRRYSGGRLLGSG